MSLLPFLYVGIILKKIDFIKRLQEYDKKWFLLVLGIVLFATDIFTAHVVSLVNNYIGNPFFYLFGALTGSFAVVLICSFLGKIPVVTYLGENSMAVLCVHGYVLNVLVGLIKHVPITPVLSQLSFWY